MPTFAEPSRATCFHSLFQNVKNYNTMNNFFADLNEIFNPQLNPMFATSTNDDNIEDVEYEEIKE
jgi:hypothetical protein